MESKIRVEITDPYKWNNTNYGNCQSKHVIEDILVHDKENMNAAPNDVHIKFTHKDSTFDIKIDKGYFYREEEDDGEYEYRYEHYFRYKDIVINISVYFNEDGDIELVYIGYWEDNGMFEDGCDADVTYEIEDCEICEVLK